MSDQSFTLFDTDIGPVGIVWHEGLIAGLQIPDTDPDRTRVAVRRRFPAAREADPPPTMRDTIEAVTALLAGQDIDLSATPVTFGDASVFDRRVYDTIRGIRRGDTMTYGEVAARLGEPRAAQAVGGALGRNPVPIIVPCHRVLAAGHRPGGFSAPGGALTKLALLSIEGAAPGGQPDLFGV